MNLKKYIEKNYEKSLQVVILLDEVQLLDSKYRFVLNKAKNELIEKVMENKRTFFGTLQRELCMNATEYSDLNNEDREVICEEIYYIVEEVIDDIIYDRFNRKGGYKDSEDGLDGFLGFM